MLRVVLLNITELERDQRRRQPSSLTTPLRTMRTKSQHHVIRKLSMLTDLNDKKVETHCSSSSESKLYTPEKFYIMTPTN